MVLKLIKVNDGSMCVTVRYVTVTRRIRTVSQFYVIKFHVGV